MSDPRGERVEPLIRYLYGPGRHEEHTDPHIVAGWREAAGLEPPLRADGRRDFRRLNGLLNQPHAALGEHGYARPVWHCAVRAAPEDRMLSDAEWAELACDIMHRAGLSPAGQQDDGVRWVAIRHAADHVHIVAMLARQDGRKPSVWRDYYKVRDACRAFEARHGLRRTGPPDGTAARRPARAETEKTRRHGWAEPPRVALRRAVATAAAGAASEQEFFARLRDTGIEVRLRRSTRDPGEVTGYAVALPADTTLAGGPVWYGGGKLAADLTLPRLRRRWDATPARHRPDTRFTPAEWQAIWDHATRAAASAAEQIRRLAATDPAAAVDAAWAAADTLNVAAAALGSRVIRQAADSYDRAARAPYGRIPRPTPAGNGLRHAARMLSALGMVTHDRSITAIALVIRLAALAEAVADLRRVQQHTAQATAARTAAERLRAATRPWTPPPPRGPARTRPRTAADVTAAAFPVPPIPTDPSQPGPATYPPARPGARPRHGPAPPRPRGPTR